MRNDQNTPPSDDLLEAVKSGYRAKLLAAALGALLVGLVGGYFVVTAMTADTDSVAPPPVAAESAQELDTDAGWSEQGAAMEAPLADPSAPLPASVNTADSIGLKSPYAWNYAGYNEAVPTVTVWEDFQCPACATFKKGPVAAELLKKADAGDINLLFRPLAFLDMSLRNDSSARATAAWGCAIDAGVGEKFRELVYENQPPAQGTGFTEAQLISGGKLAGLDGDDFTTFESCVTTGTYKTWANTSSLEAPQEVGGTPTVMVDGTVMAPKDSWDLNIVNKTIEAAK